ncbi:MAG: nucleotidyltransferase family protein [Cyanobacteria bacterium J06627_8]
MSKHSIAIIILAAGASRRMGQPKQLLSYRGQTLLSHVIQCALASSCSSVIIVLGAHSSKIAPTIEQFSIEIIINSDWHQGVSSSIRCGLNYLREKSIGGVIFLTCDQPFISTEIIERLIRLYDQSNQPIIASQYGKIVGIPCLFTCSVYPELMQVQGDSGAKSIIKKNRSRIATVEFPRGAIDLDTPADYQQFIREQSSTIGSNPI